MGGRGSGGRRVGSGRKPQHVVLTFPGSTQRKVTRRQEPVEPPTDLSQAERQVWDELAPLALELRTLTAETRRSFVDLCRARVNRDDCRARMAGDGWVLMVEGEPKKHPLEPALRGWEQRVEAAMARFALAPFGKSIGRTAETVDPFAEFEAQR